MIKSVVEFQHQVIAHSGHRKKQPRGAKPRGHQFIEAVFHYCTPAAKLQNLKGKNEITASKIKQ
ncbi:hypothetical protein [Pectinatus frisingensis]|uniref:hypothetical protein n=1 Tax=Pectinatus frisingensis TaxID=865 RepID=UPI0018C70FAC|nr:hypothetical protein [Pectinatus frisingensis]